MSQILFDHNEIQVTRYAGPLDDRAPGGDLFQLLNRRTGRLDSFSIDQWRTLGEFFGADCSPDCEGPRLTSPIPDTWRWFDRCTGAGEIRP